MAYKPENSDNSWDRLIEGVSKPKANTIDWNKFAKNSDKLKNLDDISDAMTYIPTFDSPTKPTPDEIVFWDKNNIRIRGVVDYGIDSLKSVPPLEIPESAELNKFVLIDKKDGAYVYKKNSFTTYKNEAKMFDTVMEALAFADLMENELLVDKA